MSENYDIVELVHTMVEPLVDVKEELDVSSRQIEEGQVVIEIKVNEVDAGKVIGRGGRVIKAVRTIARAAATQKSLSVEIELID
jgi:predicted RNA-binding protein YlqC (UPF0109 family)